MAKEKVYEGKVPIRHNDDGTITQLDYYNEGWMKGDKTELKDNYIFEDCLGYVDYGKGRSAVSFYFKSVKGDSYTMFISDFNKLLQEQREVWCLDGRWTFRKQGANYGLKYLGRREMRVRCTFCNTEHPVSELRIIPCEGTSMVTGRDDDDWCCPKCWEKRGYK